MPSLTPETGRAYWRSLDELADSPEFRAQMEHEFPYLSRALAANPSRRHFLKVMGASLALAGLTGCRWPKEKIVEYARRPPGRVPGDPVSFATTMELGGVGTGLLVTSFDGRPIKVEGNPLHPYSLGGTDALAQAAILEIYDPDRSRGPARASGGTPGNAVAEWQAFLASESKRLRDAKGAGLYVLAEPSSSLTMSDVRDRFLSAFPQATWIEYFPIPRDNPRAGAALAFGKPVRTILNLKNANVIASFDQDFLLTHPASVRYMRDFASRRTGADDAMSRLYVLESTLSLTGSNADQRFAVRASDVPGLLCRLAGELIKQGLALPGAAGAAKAALEKFEAGPAAPPFMAKLASDLLAHRGEGVVLVGRHQPAEAHALAHMLNQALGNVGKTVSYAAIPDSQRPSHLDAIASLCEKLGSGAVDTLVILGGNPVLTAPVDLDFAGKLAKVKTTSIHLSLYRDETSRKCTWHVPAAHFLESWGDARAWDGTVGLTQPLIEPLFGGVAPIELLAQLAGESVTSGYELVKRTIQNKFPGQGDFEKTWRTYLCDGVVPESGFAVEQTELASGDWTAPVDALAKRAAETKRDSFDVTFAQDNKIYDGRFANNAWLQELPDPLTKLTWDNAALISPVDAQRWGVKRDDRVEITLDGRKLDIPVCVLPGHAPGAITLPLGYGRKHAGPVADGAGFDVYPLRSRASFDLGRGATVRVLGSAYPLATTQDHHAMDTTVGNKEAERRWPELLREGTFADYVEFRKHQGEHHSAFGTPPGVHELPLIQLFDDQNFKNAPRWGMAIDLSKCTGCSACVVACQAENNIPVVGKHEVQLGREMHWIRIDRYFDGKPESPEINVVHQPMPCQQCENAPCEQVCPVAATSHDEQGLNVMVYNRCIGTRYCSNNCPWKVRRFNWFFNHHGPRHPRSLKGEHGVNVFETFDIKDSSNMLPEERLTDLEKMAFNPDVTVRSRGVMEKCTYCVQRIQRAKIHARNDQVSPHMGPAGDGQIPDGTVIPACAQACPAEAIVFGDLRFADSKVSKYIQDPRTYTMLGELNARPRTHYLSKLRNPALEQNKPEAKEHGEGHG